MAMDEVRVGGICPKCGKIITSISKKTIKGKTYVYVYHGRSSCYLGPAGASASTSTTPPAARKTARQSPRQSPRASASQQAAPTPSLDEIIEKITEKVMEKIQASLAQQQQALQQRLQQQYTQLIRIVTANDAKRTRGKVYVPREWIGKKVRIEPID